MGIGPAAMKVDDVVCIARGASVPLILRERKTFVGDGVIQAFNAHYERRLVGEAYVHGIMMEKRTMKASLKKFSYPKNFHACLTDSRVI